MFDWFKKTPKTGEGIIALDIGTDTIKAALFVIEGHYNKNGEMIGKSAIIKGWGKIKEMKGDLKNGKITDIYSVIQNAKKAIQLSVKQGQVIPEKLIMGIGGEFVKGTTSVIKHEREKSDEKINLSELQNIVHKLEWKAFEEARKKFSEESGYPEIDVKLIHGAITNVKIDGYKITNPLGFQGKEIEISIFNTFAPIIHYEAIEKIADELELKLINVLPQAYSLSESIDLDEKGYSAVIVNIGAGSTEISIVEEGVLKGNTVFGIGGETFTKRLAIELNINFEEAERLKIAYSNDKLEQKSKKIINDILEHDVELWLDGIVLALTEFEDINVLPTKILICGGSAKLPEVKNILGSKKWHKKLHFSQVPQIQSITQKMLKNLLDETKREKEEEDMIPSSLVSKGIDMLDEDEMDVMEKALKKVISIMKV